MERTIEVYSGKGNRERKLLKEEIRDILLKTEYRHFATHNFEFIFAELSGSLLGSADPIEELILLSSRLLNAEHGTIRNVALHEVAHIIEFRSGDRLGHDHDFRKICSALGVDEDYSKARVDISKHDRLVDRISKLEALSHSPYSEEAAAAMMKIRQLTAQYGLEIEEDGDDRIYSTVLLVTRRFSTKMNILLRIVKELTGIYAVLMHKNGEIHVTAYASYETLEVASYLWDTLGYRLDRELSSLKRRNPGLYRGVAATNGFYQGVLDGIISRREQTQEDMAAGKELVLIGNRNEELAHKHYFDDLAYITTSRRSSSFTYDRSSRSAGRDYGRNLDTRPGIKSEETLFLE